MLQNPNNEDRFKDCSNLIIDSTTLQGKAIQLVEMFCAGNSRSKHTMYRILPVELFAPIEERPDLISKYTMASIKKSTKATRKAASMVEFPTLSFDFDTKFSAAGSSKQIIPGIFQVQNLSHWIVLIAITLQIYCNILNVIPCNISGGCMKLERMEKSGKMC